jgi:hypothetical protein
MIPNLDQLRSPSIPPNFSQSHVAELGKKIGWIQPDPILTRASTSGGDDEKSRSLQPTTVFGSTPLSVRQMTSKALAMVGRLKEFSGCCFSIKTLMFLRISALPHHWSLRKPEELCTEPQSPAVPIWRN